MAELAKARRMQPYIILYKTTLQLDVNTLDHSFLVGVGKDGTVA